MFIFLYIFLQRVCFIPHIDKGNIVGTHNYVGARATDGQKESLLLPLSRTLPVILDGNALGIMV